MVRVMAIDPVCGMEVDEKTNFKYYYKGKIYYFCCKHCMDAFKKDAEKYLKEGPKGMPQ